MRQGVILLADNMEAHLKVRKALLEQAGYTVITAVNPREALALISSTYIDVAVLDIRLEDDNDEKDISGLLLARAMPPAIPKIILTGHPSPETARAALSGLVPGGAVAADYVSKGQGYEVLLETIKSVIRQKVFIAHGHDEDAKNAVALLLRNLGLRDLVLHDPPNVGHAVIDQFEHHANVGFAVIVLTPDDMGYAQAKPDEIKPRARQNVIWEMGYFVGVFKRNCVCALYKEGVERPSQYPENLYLLMDQGGLWRQELASRMKKAGLNIALKRAR